MDKSNIVLIGFMSSGKTTIGELVVASTGKRLVDTDHLIEGRAGASVGELFERDGEEGFRRMERMVVSEVALGRDLVVALGGGAVLDRRNVEDVRRNGVTYFLDVPLTEVIERSRGTTGRPLLEGRSDDEIGEMMSERRQAYLDAADVIVNAAGHDAQEIAVAIARDFEARSHGQDAGGELF